MVCRECSAQFEVGLLCDMIIVYAEDSPILGAVKVTPPTTD